MLPWTHAAFGYALLLVAAVGLRRHVSRVELAAVIVATQIPDFVDKPLSWWFNALPSGRSLAHSLVLAVPLSLAVLAVAWYRSHPTVGFAFGLGYASHLLGDSYIAIYNWTPVEFTFLLWPVLPAYPDAGYDGVVDFFGHVEVTTGLVAPLVVASFVGVGFLVHFVRAPWWRVGPQR